MLDEAKSVSGASVRLPPSELARVQRLGRITGATWVARVGVVLVWLAVAGGLGVATAWLFAYGDVSGVIALCGVYMGGLAPLATYWVRQLNALASQRRLALYPGVGEDVSRLPPMYGEAVVETRLARWSIEGLDDGGQAVRAACQYIEYLERLPPQAREILASVGVREAPISEIVFRGDNEAGVRGELSSAQQHELLLHLERFEQALWSASSDLPYR